MKKYPSVEWSKIARTRDKFIHFYFGIDKEAVWDIVNENIPILFEQLKTIIQKEGWSNELET